MGNARWWESYLFRYFVGSAVGAVIILIVSLHPDSGLSDEFKNFVDIKSFQLKDITTALSVFLLFCGVAFCYIASAPILVLHTFRCRFKYTSKTEMNWRVWCAYIIGLFITCVALYKLLKVDSFIGLLCLSAVHIVYTMVFLAIRTATHNEKSLFEYYKKLVINRALKDDKAKAEYIESYRHLREHGNAFLILFCEVSLGMALFACPNFNMASLVLFIWIIPTIPVWFVANFLESKLEDITIPKDL